MKAKRSSLLPAPRHEVFSRLQRLETLQFISAPYATFTPIGGKEENKWRIGGRSSYRLRLFGFIPFATHVISIERFDMDVIQSREHNERIHVWDHRITLRDRNGQTEYTDEVEIKAGWKTVFIWLWAQVFYAHRQQKWIKLLRGKANG